MVSLTVISTRYTRVRMHIFSTPSSLMIKQILVSCVQKKQLKNWWLAPKWKQWIITWPVIKEILILLWPMDVHRKLQSVSARLWWQPLVPPLLPKSYKTSPVIAIHMFLTYTANILIVINAIIHRVILSPAILLYFLQSFAACNQWL